MLPVPLKVAMKIVLVCDCKIPVSFYDEKTRVVWWLGKALVELGHNVSFLVRKKSECHFANVLIYNDKKPLVAQIPDDTDLVHFHDTPSESVPFPYLITEHDNIAAPHDLDPNTVFLSDSHARLHGSTAFVYPGVDFSEYSVPEIGARRIWFHFLGNASKRDRNVRGAIDLAGRVEARLHVIGGTRVNFRQGLNIPLSPTARFHGTLSPDGRDALLNASKGMIFPVLWAEPFSLAVVESLYFGCPIFGNPYGALPEQLGKKLTGKNVPLPDGAVDAFYSDYGCLTTNKAELIEAMKNTQDFDRQKCHEYAVEKFSSLRMAEDYVRLYEQVLVGRS